MNSLVLKSPSKINLYLKILGKRPDGYHELYTLFHRISLCDTIRLRKKTSGFALRVSDAVLSDGEDNIITKAYRKLQREIPDLGGVDVFLQKKIPVGAGLGGGSGNAATFLQGMKKLYGLKIPQKKLLKIGAELGADVPFFLHNIRQGIGVDRGDRIFPVKIKSKLRFVLCVAEKGLSTKEVYGNFRPQPGAGSLTKIRAAVRLLAAYLERKNLDRAADLLQNDLESPAFLLRPSLRQSLDKIKRLGSIKAAKMTGSGPTLFAILSSSRQANDLARKLRDPQKFKRVLICHTL